MVPAAQTPRFRSVLDSFVAYKPAMHIIPRQPVWSVASNESRSGRCRRCLT